MAQAQPPAPESRTFTPVWLSPADVKEWLHGNQQPVDSEDRLVSVCAAAEPYVERCRPEWKTKDGGYEPDAETYHGAVMYAAREFRRRNSPAGVEVYGEGVTFVRRFDPDIDRALQTGEFARPITA
ncbi:MAG: hypothetical protein FWF90_16260 [Promicromonosporaceae bacterium]|nr:hypothetical protein [Promicromonosporaceae bacterium]